MGNDAQSGSKVQRVLGRYPGPVTLAVSKRKWLMVLAICAGFTIVGALMASDDQPSLDPYIAWATFVFFGLGAVVAVISLFPNASGLRLDGQGFVTRTLFKRQQARSWHDVANFEGAWVGPQRMVAYDVAAYIEIASRETSQALIGHDEALPDTYGMNADELAQVMFEWRERSLAGGNR